ncbi:putative murein peptide carboxypeptidase [Phycisphaerae bacterium RAS1]|nr:putative murein peptide carboxypeptidase [Phycisphaerae bacterium RAS1]
MAKKRDAHPDRIHLLAHANPLGKDIVRFGFGELSEYIDFIARQTPRGYRVTYSQRVFEAEEDVPRGGRRDDAERVRDLQHALDDPRTAAIVALSGGAYFGRILPHLNFEGLKRRRTPLWVMGFSEMTTLVNIVASYPCGRGLYWLCPNYLAWKIDPPEAARAAFAEFWTMLPAVLSDGSLPPTPRRAARASHPADMRNAHAGRHSGDGRADAPRFRHLRSNGAPISGQLISGKITGRRARVIGGCLSVLAAALPGLRSVRPRNCWLAIEDLREEPYRIDRYLATLKLAGWFERLAGVIVGDFHTADEDLQATVAEYLHFHLPRGAQTPVVLTRDVGHVWPMSPLPINRSLRIGVDGRRVSFSI